MKPTYATFATILLSLCLPVGPMFGQSPTASVTGTVTDSQGAAVADVTVEAVASSTSQTYRAVTDAAGQYLILNLPIGGYSVRVSHPGFKSYTRSGLVLEVSQRLRLAIQLEIGAVTESVLVTAEVARVQTEESSLGAVVERKRIEALPLNGRHIMTLTRIVPGVQPRSRTSEGFGDFINQPISEIRINGGPAYGNQVFLDGSVNTAPLHNEISVVPMVDATEEFRVETNALKAEYGQTSGGVINVVSKAGGNNFSGSLYEFLRNDALDARNAFSSVPDPRTGRTKQVLRYNQYGGTLGGPVILPKIYNGRNRTFFFTGWEQWRLVQSGAPRLGTVPTAQERSGDFSNTRDGRGALLPLFDPATTRPNPAGAGFVRDPLPGNIVPRGRMDPLSLRLLEFIPQPNTTPTDPLTNSNNLTALVSSPINQTTWSARVDHRFTDSDLMFFRYSTTGNVRQDRGYGFGASDPGGRNDQRDNRNAVVNYTKVFTPRVLNDLRVAATRQYLTFLHPSFGGDWPAKLGFPSTIPQDQFPPVQITGILPLSNGSFAGGIRAQQYIQIIDSVTLSRSAHTIQAGVDHRWIRLSFINRAQPSGFFTFTPALTGNPLSPAGNGFGMATFLLGEVSGGTLGVRPFFQFRSMSTGTYIQDDWKVARGLTLNLGLRYDLSFGPTEMHNRFSNFDPFRANQQTGTSGVMQYAGATLPRTFVDQDRNNFGPRVGFAWDPFGGGRTVIRGGYGLMYTIAEIGNTVADNSNALGFSVDTPFAPVGGGPFRAFRFSDGPPSLLQPLGAAGGESAFRGFSVRYQDRNAPVPYIQQWNLTLQKALPGAWTTSLVYAGSKGTKLFGGNYNLNQLDPSFLSLGLALQDPVPNPFFGTIRTGPLSGATVLREQLLRPFPDYQNVNTHATNAASSIYHSFQLFVERRFSRGASVLISYTFSKLISGATSVGGSGDGGSLAAFRIGRLNRRQDRAIDEDDVSQRLVTSGVWELPFGRGQRWLPNSPRWLNAVVGGWQVNGIGTFQTGTPLVVRGADNFTGIAWPDVAADPTLPSDERSANRWFRTDVFRNPADFVIGNIGRTLPRTRAPGLVDVSLSGFKSFSIRERAKIEFRVELFNALNTVNLNSPNTTFTPNRQGVNTNANFGRIFGSLDPRRLQLGLRLTF